METFPRNKLERGEEASSINPKRHRNTLVYVRYKDHILFRNSNPQHYMNPNIREAIGWLIEETDEALFLTNDRSVEQLHYEKRESGLIILKSNIVERRKIE